MLVVTGYQVSGPDGGAAFDASVVDRDVKAAVGLDRLGGRRRR
jgi:hypothetical protein